MPALNFKPEFAQRVKNGEKTQSIRRARKKPIKAGDKLYLYTGLRTKNCKKIGEATVIDVSPIKICKIKEGGIFINGNRIDKYDTANRIAVDDGFSSLHNFLLFFHEQYGLPFEGVLIKWKLMDADHE